VIALHYRMLSFPSQPSTLQMYIKIIHEMVSAEQNRADLGQLHTVETVFPNIPKSYILRDSFNDRSFVCSFPHSGDSCHESTNMEVLITRPIWNEIACWKPGTSRMNSTPRGVISQVARSAGVPFLGLCCTTRWLFPRIGE